MKDFFTQAGHKALKQLIDQGIMGVFLVILLGAVCMMYNDLQKYNAQLVKLSVKEVQLNEQIRSELHNLNDNIHDLRLYIARSPF